MARILHTTVEPLDRLAEESNLTLDQLIFWVGQELYPDAPFHNMASLYTIRRAIEPTSLKAAFQTLVNSCDALRMVIDEIDSVPRYRIKPSDHANMDTVDFTDSADPKADLRAWAMARTQRMFDLERGLYDTALIKLAPQEFAWYFKLHHIVSDGISITVLVPSMLFELYGQAVSGTLPEQIELPQYRDHIERQRAYYHSEPFRRAEAYWQQKLADFPSRPSFYGNAGSQLDIRAERLVCELGTARSERLKQVVQQTGLVRSSIDATLFRVFAALLITYVHRLGGDEKIALGVPFHGRWTPEAKGTIGLLMQTLPVQVTIEAGDSFVSLVNKIATDMYGAIDHSPYATPQIGQSYDLLLNYHVAQVPDFEDTPVDYESLHLGYAQKGLMLHVHDFEGSGQLTLFFEPQSALFTPAQRQRMPQHFLQLVDAFLADPHASIHQVDYLTPAEKTRLFITWNDTAAPRRPTQCLHHLFEAQVERTPTAVAVSAGSQHLTYEKLNQRANQLAHTLKEHGVGPDTLVGICVERSLEMVIGLMGILKAGGAYVPLDPTYPSERLAFIAEDAQIPILLTQTRLLINLPPTQARIIDLEADWEHILQAPSHNPSSTVQGDHVVYVMYTSGSTGKPKGVEVLHQGVCNYLLWRKSYFPLNASDRVLQKTSFGFDDSVSELFEPLMVGAQLIMAAPDRHYDPAYLVKFMIEQDITAAVFVPSLLDLVLEEPEIAQCRTLRRVTTGGEAVTVDLQTKFFTKLEAKLYNLYGPTEASIASTCWACQPGDDRPSVPIGRPIANTQIYLLDNYLQPVPLGVPGEVHIGGIGLARGYLSRPELTEEKFIANPFSDNPHARLYKTGDLARSLPDGNLDFLGRADHQVKIRGYRIELGEIESVLNEHPHVARCVVTLREDRVGDKRLVAYVVPATDGLPIFSELSSHLRRRLPNHMVPAAFVSLDRLPLTSSGKLDRRALPAPDDDRPALESSYLAPRNVIEEQLAEIWSDVLGIEEIGVHDDFFELGGHSLLAVRVFSQLKQRTGRNLPLATLFRAPTIACLAEIIVDQAADRPGSSAVEIRSETSATPLFVVSPGAVLFLNGLARHLAPTRPLYGLQTPGLDSDDDALLDRVEELAALNLRHMRRVQPHGPYLLCGRCFGGHVAFEMARQVIAEGETIEALIVFDSAPPHAKSVPLPGSQQSTVGDRVRRMANYIARGELLGVLWGKALNRCEKISAGLTNLHMEWFASPDKRRMHRREMANWEAIKYYRAEPYAGSVTLIRSAEFSALPRKQTHLVWQDLALGGFQCRQVPGSHVGMFEEPVVRELANVIEECIAEQKGS